MFDYLDKVANVRKFEQLMLDKTLSMFEYQGLPDSLPYTELERILQTQGYAILTKEYNNKLYAFKGSLSGQEKDVYQRATKAIVAEPMFSKTLDVNSNCVILQNDDSKIGLSYLYQKYGTMLNETDISLIVANYNKRMQTIISANDDNTISSANDYLDKVVSGELGIIGSSKLFDSLNTNFKTSSSNSVTELIELQQYLKAMLLNEIGLNANYNMKRERLTDGEVQMNTDILRPFVDNMLLNRERGVKKVNEIFNTNISVDFSSIWKKKKEEMTEPEIEPENVKEKEDEKEDDNENQTE